MTSADPFSVSKTFKDLNGGVLVHRDLVEVTVSLRGTAGTQFAYLERLVGPRAVPLTDKGDLE